MKTTRPSSLILWVKEQMGLVNLLSRLSALSSSSSSSKSLQSCPTLQPHRRRQPTRLPRPWDSAGMNTGVGCHFLLQCMKVKTESEVAQSSPTLCDPMDCSPPGSSIHGIFQARVLGWGAIAFSLELLGSLIKLSVVTIFNKQFF